MRVVQIFGAGQPGLDFALFSFGAPLIPAAEAAAFEPRASGSTELVPQLSCLLGGLNNSRRPSACEYAGSLILIHLA